MKRLALRRKSGTPCRLTHRGMVASSEQRQVETSQRLCCERDLVDERGDEDSVERSRLIAARV